MKKLLVFLGIAGIILSFSPDAFAVAVADASAWYDWTSLSIQVSYPDPTNASSTITRDAVGGNSWGDTQSDFIWWGTPTTANADAANDIQPPDTDSQGPEWDWTQSYQSIAQVTNAQGLATVPVGGATTTASGHALSDGIVTSATTASSAIHRGANFFSNINALYIFSIDSGMSHTISKDDAAESAWGTSNLNFFLTVNDDYQNLLAWDFETASHTDSADFDQLFSQSFQYNVIASRTDRYTFGGSAHSAVSANSPRSDAVVPEPFSLSLFGLGFGALLFKRRKNQC